MSTHRTTPTPADTVDWAFVTEGPCTQCGFAPGERELSAAETLRASAASWQETVERDDVRERPSPEVWSPLEYAAHTRDVVGLFHERISLLLEKDDPRFGSWDGEQVAVDSDYGAQDPAVVAAEYAQAADETAALLDEHFGGFDAFQTIWAANAAGIQGSGWSMLAWDTLGKRPILAQLYDQQSQLPATQVPILVLDMWEHAFYLQYKNVKPDYVKAWWNVVNWADVAQRYAAAKG